MRTIRNLALCIPHFAFVFAAALSGFAKTFDVDISTGRPAASNEAYYHGETIEFRAVRGRSVVTNIEYASIYYQTNGMGDVWWRTDGLVFHPTNDVGAASYRFFMEGREVVSGGVESGGVDSPTPSLTHSPTISRDWHANGLLRLLPSPGFTPNTLQLPVATLDFAAVEVLNPPYYDKAETEAKIVELAPAPGNYAAVSNAAVHAAITNALQDTALESHASQLSQLSQSLDGKADREIVIGQVKGLPGDCFPIAYVYNGDSYSIVNSGGIVVDQFGPAYYRLADSVTGVAVCYFRISDGTYFSNGEASGITFGGTAPTQLAWPVLGDVPKKSSVVYDVDIKTNYYDKAETEAKIVELAPAPGDYAAVSNAAMNAVQPTNMPMLERYPMARWSDNIYIVGDDDINVSTEYHGTIAHRIFDGWSLSLSTYFWDQFSDVALSGSYNDLTDTPEIPSAADFSTSNAALVATIEATAPAPGNYAAVSNAAVHAAITNALQDATISTLCDSISTLSNTTSTVSSGLSQLADEAAPAINGYARLYSFITGSTNANFVVTNYQLTAEAEASRTHFDPSDPDLDFSTVPPSLRLEDASSGTNRVVVDTRDWVVWYYAQKIGGAMAEAVSTAVDTCRAWCGFTATGLENPAPDTLVVDVPNIWLMAGKTFEKHIAGSNAVWIIRSSGVVMPISDNSQSAGGFLELTDAFGTPYIRFRKTESYFVDPAADGVEYDSATGAWLVTYTTTTCPKGGANAVLEGSTTYPGKAILKDEDDPDCPATITWTGSANNWVMHAVPKQIDGAVPTKMFFAAVVEVQGQDYIEYLRPMSVPSLMFNGTTYTSTVSGNELKFIATQP